MATRELEKTARGATGPVSSPARKRKLLNGKSKTGEFGTVPMAEIKDARDAANLTLRIDLFNIYPYQ